MHKVKSSGPSTEPCGTLYKSVTLSVFYSYGLMPIFLNEKTKFELDQFSHTTLLEVYLITQHGQ